MGKCSKHIFDTILLQSDICRVSTFGRWFLNYRGSTLYLLVTLKLNHTIHRYLCQSLPRLLTDPDNSIENTILSLLTPRLVKVAYRTLFLSQSFVRSSWLAIKKRKMHYLVRLFSFPERNPYPGRTLPIRSQEIYVCYAHTNVDQPP